MDKKIKAHFGPKAKSPTEKKELKAMLKLDKKLDKQIDRDEKKGKK